MADFGAPSFSLGLDLEMDFDLEPRADSIGAEYNSLPSCAPRNLTIEFEAEVSDSEPEVSAPARKRLRRGLGRPRRRELPEAWCSVEEEIEEFSSQEGFKRDNPSTQCHSVCGSSKVQLRAPGVLTNHSVSHRKARKREQDSNLPASASMETSCSKLMFPKLTISPLRRFQLIDSDSESDDSSVSEVPIPYAKENNLLAKATQSHHKQYSAANAEDRKKTFVSLPQDVDLWKDFCPNISASIPTPALDEVCEEYFRSVKGQNATLKPGSDGCISNNMRSYQNRNNRTILQQSESKGPLPPAHSYFFHDDPRIQNLVRSRLPNFYPLGVNSTPMQPDASAIDYMSQFRYGGASKKQINQGTSIERSTTQARKNVRKSNSGEALDDSGSWMNPKSSASSTKKTGKKQVQANGQSSGRWFTSPDGRKVYVTKSGQELTGSSAYRHYKKDNGVRFKRSKRKATAKRTLKQKQKE